MGRRLPLTNVIAMFPLHHYSSFMSGVFEDATPSNHSPQPFLLRSYGRIGLNLTKSQASNVTLHRHHPAEKMFLGSHHSVSLSPHQQVVRGHQRRSCQHLTMISLLRF